MRPGRIFFETLICLESFSRLQYVSKSLFQSPGDLQARNLCTRAQKQRFDTLVWFFSLLCAGSLSHHGFGEYALQAKPCWPNFPLYHGFLRICPEIRARTHMYDPNELTNSSLTEIRLPSIFATRILGNRLDKMRQTLQRIPASASGTTETVDAAASGATVGFSTLSC